MKALKKEYDGGWELAISAGLPLAETVDPSKFPDLVYAGCVYYKSQKVSLANWRIPEIESAMSKAEILRFSKSLTKFAENDDFLSRLPEDVKFLVLNRLAPKSLIAMAGVNKTLRRFMRANAGRLLSTSINTLVLSPVMSYPLCNVEPRIIEWEFFIVSPHGTLFGHRRTEPNPEECACPTKDLGTFSNILSVLPWLSFNERCDVVFRDILDSKNRGNGVVNLRTLEDRRPTDLETLARIVREVKEKTIATWKDGKSRRPSPISLFFEKGMRGSAVELRTVFKLFANCSVSNVIWDHKHVEVWELNEVIIAAASSVHRLRSFQFEASAYPLPVAVKPWLFLNPLLRHDRRCQCVSVKGITFPIEFLFGFFEKMCRHKTFRVPLYCVFELSDRDGSDFEAKWKGKFTEVLEKELPVQAAFEYDDKRSSLLKFEFGKTVTSLPDWFRNAREYNYLNWLDHHDDYDDYNYGGYEYDDTFDYGSDWASA